MYVVLFNNLLVADCIVWITDARCVTVAHRTAGQLEENESVRLKENFHVSVLHYDQEYGTPEEKKKPLSLWGNRTAEQRGALVPLLRYLLNSNTPGDDPTRRERDGGSSWCDPHSLTATSARGWAGGAAEWWVEHQQGIEEASAAPSSGWWYITVCTAASIHPSPYHSSSARSFIKITSKMGKPRVCFVGKRDGISSDPVGLLAAGSRRWLHQQRLDADIFFYIFVSLQRPRFSLRAAWRRESSLLNTARWSVGNCTFAGIHFLSRHLSSTRLQLNNLQASSHSHRLLSNSFVFASRKMPASV